MTKESERWIPVGVNLLIFGLISSYLFEILIMNDLAGFQIIWMNIGGWNVLTGWLI